MNIWKSLPQGLSICFVQQCPACAGSGVMVSPVPSAANDLGASGAPYGSSTSEQSCPRCINGFKFAAFAPDRLLPELLKDLLNGVDQGTRELLLDVIVKATEERMGRDK